MIGDWWLVVGEDSSTTSFGADFVITVGTCCGTERTGGGLLVTGFRVDSEAGTISCLKDIGATVTRSLFAVTCVVVATLNSPPIFERNDFSASSKFVVFLSVD